jgi:hypothetical protein
VTHNRWLSYGIGLTGSIRLGRVLSTKNQPGCSNKYSHMLKNLRTFAKLGAPTLIPCGLQRGKFAIGAPSGQSNVVDKVTNTLRPGCVQ